jgi:hypothetical protein
MTETIAATPGNTAPASAEGPQTAPPFSAEQLHQMAQWEIDAGRLTREQADAMLGADGVKPRQAQAVGPTAAEIDAAFTPAEPHQYQLPPLAGDDVSNAALLAYNKTAREWLHTARFDRERGSSLANEIARTAEATKRMADSDREIHRRTELSKLERLWGDQTQSKIKLARQLVRELEEKTPGLVDLLAESGAGNNSLVIKMLAEQAELLAGRQGT